MMNYALSLILILFLPIAAISEDIIISLEMAVKTSDIIVIGTLKNVTEETKDGMDYGKGEITVDEVLLGNAKENEKLILVWQNRSNIDCPRVEHRNHQNKQAIWLVTQKSKGEVAADNLGRFVSVEKKESVLDLIQERQSK
ncbi:MAG TPA: hypothetical protein VGB02_00150 [Pyrinomonadaceae bacterium]|jgi:hypothetical protein